MRTQIHQRKSNVPLKTKRGSFKARYILINKRGGSGFKKRLKGDNALER